MKKDAFDSYFSPLRVEVELIKVPLHDHIYVLA